MVEGAFAETMIPDAKLSMGPCPACGQNSLTEFFSRKDVPVHMHTLFSDRRHALDIQRGSIRLAFCEHCGFVSNLDFDLSRMHYDSTYDNAQTYSPTCVEYMDDLANRLLFQEGVQHCTVVEVGCGSGAFLRKLVEKEKASNKGIGFDPAYRGPDTELDGRLRFEKQFYDHKASDTQADVVICRHVIEHVPNPLDLLLQIKAALSRSPDARVFFETPCFEWILRNEAYWDICYEHCSYFAKNSLHALFKRAGFHTRDIKLAFGGQYLWLEAQVCAPQGHISQHGIAEAAMDFAAYESAFVAHMKRELRKFDGHIAIWGAGAKGVSFANLVDPTCKLVDCVVDLNPQKQGGYIPGTGHPIVPYQDLPARGVKSALLMNPNYRNENMSFVEDNGQTLQFSDIGSRFI